MTTISDGTTTITPHLVEGYEAATASANVFHRILGRPDDDVSLAPDALRRGELRLMFLTAEAAWAAHALHAAASAFTIVDADVPQIGMRYVRNGDMSVKLDPKTLTRWQLTVGFAEVAP